MKSNNYYIKIYKKIQEKSTNNDIVHVQQQFLYYFYGHVNCNGTIMLNHKKINVKIVLQDCDKNIYQGE